MLTSSLPNSKQPKANIIDLHAGGGGGMSVQLSLDETYADVAPVRTDASGKRDAAAAAAVVVVVAMSICPWLSAPQVSAPLFPSCEDATTCVRTASCRSPAAESAAAPWTVCRRRCVLCITQPIPSALRVCLPPPPAAGVGVVQGRVQGNNFAGAECELLQIHSTSW